MKANYTDNKRLYAFKTALYCRCIPRWVAYSFSITLLWEHVRRYCECFARPTSKASISQLAFGSSLIRLAQTEHELQKLWPRFHKESNDVKISGHIATSHHFEAREELKALLKFGDGGVIINQNSLTLSHSSLTSASLSSPPVSRPLSARDGTF